MENCIEIILFIIPHFFPYRGSYKKLLLEHRIDSERWGIIGGSLKVNESLVDLETHIPILQDYLARM